MSLYPRDSGGEKLTPLEALEPLLHLLLALLTLFDLVHLDLLAELLALALLALLFGTLDACALVEKPLPDALHVRVVLDHLREVVCWAGEGEAVFLRKSARGLRAMQSLLVAEEDA